MIEPTYFIYLHKRNDTGEVFYVGKGTRTAKKAYGRSHSRANRNPMWGRIVAKCGGTFCVEIVAEFFSEVDAFDMERTLIAEYGRKNCGGGTLANMTNGGEGATGRKTSTETIEKFRTAMRSKPNTRRQSPMLGKKHTAAARLAISFAGVGEKNSMFGREHSEESRAKMSVAIRANNTRARRVVDATTGVVYRSGREAARSLNLNPNTLKAWLSGLHENKSTLRYAR